MPANPPLQQTGRTQRPWPRHATHGGRLLNAKVVRQSGCGWSVKREIAN